MLKWFGWGVMTFLALGITLVASRYLMFDSAVYFPQQRLVYEARTAGIVAHVAGGMVALMLGPFQLLTRLRAHKPQIHRWIGRLYLVGVLLGGLAGLYMAVTAYTGVVAALGFGALALAWLTTGALALHHIRHGDSAEHKRWMLRNFALTFAAVTLRLELPLLAMAFGFETAYMLIAWVCWIPNLLIIEWWIARQPTAADLRRRMAARV